MQPSNSIEFVVDIIKSYWMPGKKILEVGCGPAYLRKYFKEDYTGSDITDQPYTETIPRTVDYVCPADNLIFSKEQFDIVIIKSALFLFDNYKAALAEVYRVLSKNGMLIIFDYNFRTQKILCKKEGHSNYPCWTQWKLAKIIKNIGFKKTKLALPLSIQPQGIKRLYMLGWQELKGNWAIVIAQKT